MNGMRGLILCVGLPGVSVVGLNGLLRLSNSALPPMPPFRPATVSFLSFVLGWALPPPLRGGALLKLAYRAAKPLLIVCHGPVMPARCTGIVPALPRRPVVVSRPGAAVVASFLPMPIA